MNTSKGEDVWDALNRRESVAEVDTQQDLEAGPMDTLALQMQLQSLDASTQQLFAQLLESTQQAERKLEASGAKDLDEVAHLELLMSQMDNTYDALGELETRAEDILAKLDTFLVDNGYDGIHGEDGDGDSFGAGDALTGDVDGNVISSSVGMSMEGVSTDSKGMGGRGLNGKGDALALANLTATSVTSPLGLNSSAKTNKGTSSTGIASALPTLKKAKGK
ncbi:hypothetical protein BC830DRAFT_1144677 [Chytriomyces sp. MP71]|nr:hypothetical protein BC830DRAFT_1144677 [Chytriomyces sp. MP71]